MTATLIFLTLGAALVLGAMIWLKGKKKPKRPERLRLDKNLKSIKEMMVKKGIGVR
jgi:hypothetical protein